MISIINYKMGNIHSIKHALNYLGVESCYTKDDEVIKQSSKIILPGVGSFRKAMETLNQSGMTEVIKQQVLENKKPILGICLGMQLMALSSDEDGETKGFGFIGEDIRKFEKIENVKIPHVGFNTVEYPIKSILFKGLRANPDFYFTHSHCMNTRNEINMTIGICDHGDRFIASYEKENIFGVQFHPEKSQNNGLKLLKNFIEFKPC